MSAEDERRKMRIMKILNVTEKDALSIMESDKRVDRMKDSEVNSDLTPEQKQAVKKYSGAGTRKVPMVPKLDASDKPKKENPTKEGIIAEISNFLSEKSQFEVENCKITNKTREITFQIAGKQFTLTLIENRKPK